MVSQDRRRELIILSRRKSARKIGWPHDWHPEAVALPAGGGFYTHSEAWELVACLLEQGCEVEEIEMENPKGSRGFVILTNHPPAPRRLYIKVQLGSGQIIGRSFHYSKYQ